MADRKNRLPATVPLLDIADAYDAANPHDMHRFANVLRSLKGDVAAMTAVGLVDKRVMFPPARYRFPEWIWTKRGRDPMLFWCHVFRHPRIGEKMARDILADAARWAVHGKDTEDANSVGGFSQREVNFITNGIAIVQDFDLRDAA